MTTHSLEFRNQRGERLDGLLELGAETWAHALFAHCFTCSKDFKAPVYVSRALAQRGIGTVRFDFPGLGRSEGAFENTTLSGNAEDIVAAVRVMAERQRAPRILLGHSMGGAAVIRAAAQLPSIELVGILAAPAEPAAHGATFAHARKQALADGEAQLRVAGRVFRLRRTFFEDLQGEPLTAVLARLDAAVLVFHAPEDPVVPAADGRQLYDAARHPKGIIDLPGAGHLIDRRSDAELVAAIVTAWAERHVTREATLPDEAVV